MVSFKLPCIDPDHLIRYNFLGEHAESKQKATVVGVGENQDFVVEYADGTTTEQTYEEIINSISKAEEEGGEVWTFKRILNHKVKKKNGKEEVFVKVEWDIGPPTWEPLEQMRKDDPVSVAEYVHKRGLKGQRHWTWANKYLKNPKKFLRMTRQVMLAKQNKGPKYKFGTRVPRNIKEALALDKEAGNDLWKQAIKKEMDKIIEFEVFIIPKDGKIPQGYQRIPCHMIFDVKFDGRRKARFVAGGHLTLDPGEDS